MLIIFNYSPLDFWSKLFINFTSGFKSFQIFVLRFYMGLNQTWSDKNLQWQQAYCIFFGGGLLFYVHMGGVAKTSIVST